MIPRIAFFAALASFVLAGVSCDKHAWEETRVLHGHGSHHGDDHDHKTDPHGEKADEAHAEKQ